MKSMSMIFVPEGTDIGAMPSYLQRIIIARLGTAHGASVRRLRDEWERGSPLTRAWALDLYERMGPWSGLVGPGDVPLLDAKDEAA